jgi:cation:H+ antiporter
MIALKLIAGLIFLVFGAEALVKGASRIAAAAGISPLVIGLTVVAFGTSAPELAVSVMSSANGQTDIALGNVIGSNIFNVLFILGISSIIIPLVVAQQLIRLDVPIMIGASLLTLLLAWDGVILPWEGWFMLALGISYTVFIIRLSRKEKNIAVLKEYEEEFSADTKPEKSKTALNLLLLVAGLVLLVLGSRWLVDGAVTIATSLGVSNLVIGLTIIAAGTSLPEVATSVIAGIRGERDIAVGNVVGSNIFNLLYILSLSAIIGKGGIKVADTALIFDLPVMVATAVACLPIFFTGKKLDRWEGVVFLGYYVAYTTYLILANQRHHSLENFSTAMIWFVIPLTVLTLAVATARELRKNKA